jgi:phage anti-repressor protein
MYKALPVGSMIDNTGNHLVVEAVHLHKYLNPETDFEVWQREIRSSFTEDVDFHLGFPLTEETTFEDLISAKFDCSIGIPAAIKICLSHGGNVSTAYDAIAYLADCQSLFLELQYRRLMDDDSIVKVVEMAKRKYGHPKTESAARKEPS